MQESFNVVVPEEIPFTDFNKVPRSLQIPIKDLVDLKELVRNSKGFIRWNLIRDHYYSGLLSESDVKDMYCLWRDQPEFYTNDGFDVWGDYHTSVYGKSAKRGNDVYKHLIQEKFKVLDSLPSINFTEIFDDKSPMVFLTLTVDTKKYTLREAWHQFSDQFHLFETKLRQEYGDFVRLRVWEAHESGYPHCHVCYYFKQRMFVTFPSRRKSDKKLIHRIVTKHTQKMSDFWSMGFVDVQAVTDTSGAISEIVKYVTKSVFNEKGNMTNAMICLFNKQQYSISKDFIRSIWGDLRKAINPKDISLSHLVKGQRYNCNKHNRNIVDFRFCGVLSEPDIVELMKKEPPPSAFFDQDYSVLMLHGLVALVARDSRLYSGSFDLSDECLRFELGLDPLSEVMSCKKCLLQGWFDLVGF